MALAMTNPIDARRGVDQFAGIGVRRIGEQDVGFADLDDAPPVHHRGRRTDMGDDGEIVADQEKGHPRLALEITHQVERLRLHRDVERRYWLVGDDQPWPSNERPRDGDALPLAARKLMRVLPGVGSLEADSLERGLNASPALCARRSAERRQRLGHDLLDALARVERAVRVLEDHLHMGAGGAQFAARQIEQRAPLKAHHSRVGPIERESDTR